MEKMAVDKKNKGFFFFFLNHRKVLNFFLKKIGGKKAIILLSGIGTLVQRKAVIVEDEIIKKVFF